MAISLPIKPDILMHFENGRSRDVYKYGDINKANPPQFSLANIHNKFGKSAATFSVRLAFNHCIDTTKSFTLSYWIYDPICTYGAEYLVFNRESGSLRGGFEFGWAPSSSGNRVCCLSSKYVTTYDSEIRESPVYAISQDVGVLLHIEVSFDSTTKICRIFRNGIIVWQQTLSFYMDNISKNLFFEPINAVYLDELLLIQTCLHTAAFTPPAEPYIWLDGPRTAKDQNNKLYGYK